MAPHLFINTFGFWLGAARTTPAIQSLVYRSYNGSRSSGGVLACRCAGGGRPRIQHCVAPFLATRHDRAIFSPTGLSASFHAGASRKICIGLPTGSSYSGHGSYLALGRWRC